jgi:uncharacterized protein with HEPN domain
MTPEDLIRIRHMLDAIKEVHAFTIDKCREDLDNNRMQLWPSLMILK